MPIDVWYYWSIFWLTINIWPCRRKYLSILMFNILNVCDWEQCWSILLITNPIISRPSLSIQRSLENSLDEILIFHFCSPHPHVRSIKSNSFLCFSCNSQIKSYILSSLLSLALVVICTLTGTASLVFQPSLQFVMSNLYSIVNLCFVFLFGLFRGD